MSTERERPLSRRQLFRLAGTSAVAVGTAAAFGTLAGGCGSNTAAAPSTTGASSTTTPGRPPDWSKLAGELSGTLVLPSDAAYATDKHGYNERFDSIDPAAIAYVERPSDVQRCVDFARHTGVPFAARSGGHSYGGYSLSTGLVVDVSRMHAVTVNGAARQARVGAGTQLVDVYSQLADAGVLVPGGSCPTVGIAGLALGGGIGVFGRNYGLTCDNIASLDLVTADGSLLTCSPTSHEDLYWACRGGGGGNFGIVTAFEFTVHPIPDVALFTLEWPWSAAPTVLGAWQHWMAAAPDPLWSNCQLLSSGGQGLKARVTGVYCGSATELSQALAPLRRAVGGNPTTDFVGPEPYRKAVLIEAGCEGKSVAECHLAGPGSKGTLPRSAFAAKSAFVDTPMPDAGIGAVTSAVETLHQDLGSLGGGFVFDSWGGKVNTIKPADTAFVHRDALFGIEYSVNWSQGASQSVIDSGSHWLTTSEQAIAPNVTGAYQNYIDPTLADWQHAYYGSNLARLEQVKAAVDPDDVFHFAQSIPLPGH